MSEEDANQWGDFLRAKYGINRAVAEPNIKEEFTDELSLEVELALADLPTDDQITFDEYLRYRR